MTRMKAAGALVALACAGLGGCVDVHMLGTGQPDPTLATNLLIDAHVVKEDPTGSGTFVDQTGQCETHDDQPSPAKDKRADPTECYWRTKSLIDYRYQVYKTNLLHAVNSGTFAGDFISLGLNVAGTITPGATAAKLFNALAGAATSTKSFISQDVLYKQTITILISEMDSDRADESAKIEKGLAANPSLEEVIDELEEYYETGTFQHALVTLQSKAGSSKTTTPTQTPAAAAQTVVTIEPAAGGASFTPANTFEIKGTVGSTPIDAAYTPDGPESAIQVAAGLAAQKEFKAGGVTAVASGTTVTLSYSTTSPVTWTAVGPDAQYIEVAPPEHAPSPKEPKVKTPEKPDDVKKAHPAAVK